MNTQRKLWIILLLLFAAGTQGAPTLVGSSATLNGDELGQAPIVAEAIDRRLLLSAKFADGVSAVTWTVDGERAQTDRNRRRGRTMLSRFGFTIGPDRVTDSAEQVFAIRATATGKEGATAFVDWAVTVINGDLVGGARVGGGVEIGNQSPTGNPVRVAEGASQVFSVSASAGTPPYQYVWQMGAGMVGNDASSYSFTPDFNSVAHPARDGAAMTLSCTVVDSLDAEVAASWSVVVTDVDRAPALPSVAILPAAPTTRDTLSLEIQQPADPDGDAVFYDVSWSAQAARAAFEGESLDARHTRRGESWRAQVIVVTNPYSEVPKSSQQSASAQTMIANSAPRAESAEVEILQNDSRRLTLPGSDADSAEPGEGLSYRILRHPDFGELRDLDEASGEVTYLTASQKTGRTKLRYRVTDDRGESAIGELRLNVIGWTLPIEVSDGQVTELMLGMGADDQDQDAPPGLLATLEAGPRRMSRDIRGDEEDAIWELLVDARQSAGDVLVKWNTEHVPHTGLFLTPIDAPGAGGEPSETQDMSQLNRLIVPAGTRARYRIRHAIFEYDLDLQPGWQLIGFPFDPIDEDVTLGGRLQQTLGFGGDYIPAKSLGAHGGYFAFVAGGPSRVRVAGRHQRKMAGTLQDGWNLVSLALPPGTREVTYARFLEEYPQASNVAWALVRGEYRVARVLRKGVSYWVYVEPDMSGLGPLSFDELPEDRPLAIAGALEGGATGTADDTAENNTLAEADQITQDIFEVPTNGPPSPLFGAAPFSQQMLRFEEFGTADLDLKNSRKPHGWKNLPAPAGTAELPPGHAVEQFLTQPIWPTPTAYSNTTDRNPWEPIIESYLGRDLAHPPAEGRPPGVGWSHQRWDEFTPERYFQTATTGARMNGGFRDAVQKHGYASGEFGPGGLYHGNGTTSGIEVRLHPSMPLQDPDAVWTFDGTFPPKLLNVRYGEPVLMRHYNALPVDVAANRGFGLHTLTTHEHNGHSPAESDG
ncbi:MAG: hypothetical protein ACI8W8_004212, partial [Rhodothermales bacterium]